MTIPDPIGCVADDVTGATDLASALAATGLDTRLAFGSAAIASGGDAIVVALKVRSVPAADARRAVVEAAGALREAGATQLFSKYCSTFDSTADGNIGPIADALADLQDAGLVVHCPSYPANGRTVYLGHLFVNGELLSESPMRDHPLNPMRDSQLVRLLSAQTERQVARLPLAVVDRGSPAVMLELGAQQAAGARHVIADAVRDADLATVADAAAAAPLAAGGAAFGAAFAAAARRRAGAAPVTAGRARVPSGPAAILVGSLSKVTREQVKTFGRPALALDLQALIDGDAAVAQVREVIGGGLVEGPLLITTELEAGPAGRANRPRRDEVARAIERTMGRVSVELHRAGVRRLIVAGGETSGEVARALALRSARIGPDISVGVPWMVDEDRSLAVAFKSGNFGAPTFFADALAVAGA